MSRILMGSMQITGHVMPGLPLARKLVERGHDVWWYTGRKFAEKVALTGATFVPMSAETDYDDAELDIVHPERARLEGVNKLKYDIKHIFADAARHHFADLSPVMVEFQPDLLLVDSAFTGGLPLRHAFDVPLAHYGPLPLMMSSVDTAPFGFGLMPSSGLLGRLRNRAMNWVVDRILFGDVNAYGRNALAELGVPASSYSIMDIPRTSDLYLQLSDETFEYPRSDAPPQIKFVGPVLPDLSGEFVLPAWWEDMVGSEKPVVHVTQGTIATNSDDLIVPTLRALADEDVLVVVSTGGKPVDTVKLAPLPANARIATFIPYGPFLPHVDMMVTNGGYGGVQLALANGIPLVVAGDSEDKPEVANRVQWAGVGINLRTGKPKPEHIKHAVRKLIHNPAYSERARQMRARILRHDAPTLVAEHIEALIASRQPARTEVPVSA